MVELSYRPVPPAVQNRIATLHCGTLAAKVRATVPALLGQLWFCTAPVWWVAPGAGAPALLPAVSLIGPTTAAFELMAEGDGPVFGVGLWPLGWAEIVRQDASAMADRAVDAREVWPDLFAPAVVDWDTLDRVVRALAASARPSPDSAAISTIDAWLDGSEGVDTLVARLGRSSRQVARITARTHGGPPRLIAAKWRTLRAASELGLRPQASAWWSERFADQSHAIREFRRFIGSTPGNYAASPGALPQRVLSDPWHVQSDHPLALARPDPITGSRSGPR